MCQSPLAIFRALCAAAALAALTGCVNGSSIAPKPASAQSGTSAVGIKYLSDGADNVIDVFAGKFAGQAPCGQITSGLNAPFGLFVKASTHDLYVANTLGMNVLVFHRGRTTPYNSYIDPSGQFPCDVAVARDGTLLVSNENNVDNSEHGSISTWIGGPGGGTFVGNFPMSNDIGGAFITVKKNGTVYFDDYDQSTNGGAIWSTSCPAGACGAQTEVFETSLATLQGLGSDSTGDLLVNESSPNQSSALTFELPNKFPSSFPLPEDVFGMAINEDDHHWFVADNDDKVAAEFTYPGGKLVGTVPCGSGCIAIGVAVDPGHAVK